MIINIVDTKGIDKHGFVWCDVLDDVTYHTKKYIYKSGSIMSNISAFLAGINRMFVELRDAYKESVGNGIKNLKLPTFVVEPIYVDILKAEFEQPKKVRDQMYNLLSLIIGLIVVNYRIYNEL